MFNRWYALGKELIAAITRNSDGRDKLNELYEWDIAGLEEDSDAHTADREMEIHSLNNRVTILEAELASHCALQRHTRKKADPLCAENADLPHRRTESDQAGRDRGAEVPSTCEPAASMRLVGQWAGAELCKAHQPVAESLDKAECARGGMERGGDERRQDRRGDLVAGIGEETRGRHADHPCAEPRRVTAAVRVGR